MMAYVVDLDDGYSFVCSSMGKAIETLINDILPIMYDDMEFVTKIEFDELLGKYNGATVTVNHEDGDDKIFITGYEIDGGPITPSVEI